MNETKDYIVDMTVRVFVKAVDSAEEARTHAEEWVEGRNWPGDSRAHALEASDHVERYKQLAHVVVPTLEEINAEDYNSEDYNPER